MSHNHIYTIAFSRQNDNAAARIASNRNVAIMATVNGSMLEISRIRRNENTGVFTLSMTRVHENGKIDKTVRVCQATIPNAGKVLSYGAWLYMDNASKQEIARLFARAEQKITRANKKSLDGYNELTRQANKDFLTIARNNARTTRAGNSAELFDVDLSAELNADNE